MPGRTRTVVGLPQEVAAAQRELGGEQAAFDEIAYIGQEVRGEVIFAPCALHIFDRSRITKEIGRAVFSV
jgi:hypothetical protein